MASFPVGDGVRKKLTLQTKKRYQLCSPTTTKQSSSEGGKSKPPPTTRCDDALRRKRLFSYCVPTPNLMPPLPASTLAADANTEVKPTLSSLPPSNFELLTRRLPIPLDLKKCPSEPVIVIDDLADACHYKQQTTSKQGVAAPFVQQHRAASHDHKGVGGTHVAHVVQVTTHQNTTLKKDFHFTQPKKPSYPLHQPSYKGKSSSSIISHQTSENHSDITDRIKDSDHIQVWSCHKCTWNEVNDEDDEFDELCQMVDLSDSFDDNEQVMITPDSSHTWTCPMCNEVLTGKSAEEHEYHLVKCLAMDVP